MVSMKGHDVGWAAFIVIAAGIGWGAPAVAAEESEQPTQSEEAEIGAVKIGAVEIE